MKRTLKAIFKISHHVLILFLLLRENVPFLLFSFDNKILGLNKAKKEIVIICAQSSSETMAIVSSRRVENTFLLAVWPFQHKDHFRKAM